MPVYLLELIIYRDLTSRICVVWSDNNYVAVALLHIYFIADGYIFKFLFVLLIKLVDSFFQISIHRMS